MPGKNILICCRASGNGDGSKANQHVAPLAGGFDRHFSTDSYFFLIAYNFIKLVKKNLQI